MKTQNITTGSFVIYNDFFFGRPSVAEVLEINGNIATIRDGVCKEHRQLKELKPAKYSIRTKPGIWLRSIGKNGKCVLTIDVKDAKKVKTIDESRSLLDVVNTKAQPDPNISTPEIVTVTDKTAGCYVFTK